MFKTESYIIHDGHIQLRSKVIEPLGKACGDYVNYAVLARRLDYDHL